MDTEGKEFEGLTMITRKKDRRISHEPLRRTAIDDGRRMRRTMRVGLQWGLLHQMVGTALGARDSDTNGGEVRSRKSRSESAFSGREGNDSREEKSLIRTRASL